MMLGAASAERKPNASRETKIFRKAQLQHKLILVVNLKSRRFPFQSESRYVIARLRAIIAQPDWASLRGRPSSISTRLLPKEGALGETPHCAVVSNRSRGGRS